MYVMDVLELARKEGHSLYTSTFSLSHFKRTLIESKRRPEGYYVALTELIQDYGLQILKVRPRHKHSANEMMRELNCTEEADFEDFVNVAIALEHGISVFLTRDEGLMKLAGGKIKIMSPKFFILSY